MGYLSLYKTLAEHTADKANRTIPHVSLISDLKRLVFTDESNKDALVNNVEIVESFEELNTDGSTTTSSTSSTTSTSSVTPTPTPTPTPVPGPTPEPDTTTTSSTTSTSTTPKPDGGDSDEGNNDNSPTPSPTPEPNTTTSSTTSTSTKPAQNYFTEMPIHVKMIDSTGNEVENTLPVTFDIDCNGYSKTITLTSSGTLSGYHPYDNNGIESFYMSCDTDMYYKEGNGYSKMPEITSYSQFTNYYHKGGAIYIFPYLVTTPTPVSTSAGGRINRNIDLTFDYDDINTIQGPYDLPMHNNTNWVMEANEDCVSVSFNGTSFTLDIFDEGTAWVWFYDGDSDNAYTRDSVYYSITVTGGSTTTTSSTTSTIDPNGTTTTSTSSTPLPENTTPTPMTTAPSDGNIGETYTFTWNVGNSHWAYQYGTSNTIRDSEVVEVTSFSQGSCTYKIIGEGTDTIVIYTDIANPGETERHDITVTGKRASTTTTSSSTTSSTTSTATPKPENTTPTPITTAPTSSEISSTTTSSSTTSSTTSTATPIPDSVIDENGYVQVDTWECTECGHTYTRSEGKNGNPAQCPMCGGNGVRTNDYFN